MAFFDITKNNLTNDDPTSSDPTDVIEVAEQTSQGVEVGFTYTASTAFQVYGNAAVLNAETDTGEKPTYTPENTYNLGLAWSIGDAVRIITDARYVGERVVGYPTEIPSYTLLSTLLCVGTSATISASWLKADNIFDELYASRTILRTCGWSGGRER